METDTSDIQIKACTHCWHLIPRSLWTKRDCLHGVPKVFPGFHWERHELSEAATTTSGD